MFKKTNFLVFLILVSFFACTTNPIKYSNFNPDKKPAAPKIFTFLIPGLPQILMGEYLEGIVYFGAFAAYTYSFINPPLGIENKEYLPGMGLFFGISGLDGLLSNSERQKAWEKINKHGPVTNEEITAEITAENQRKLGFKFNFSDPYNDDLIKISCVGLENAEFGQLYTSGKVGTYIQIDSLVNSAILIRWDQSSIDFGNGNSGTLFMDGQKYSDAGNPAPSQPLMPNKSIRRMISSSTQPFYITGQYSRWILKRLPSYDFIINICISINNEDRYYPINVIIY